jgi:hypothetical protein
MAKKAVPSHKFNAVTYDADDCVQSARLTVNGVDITYSCNGNEKFEAGDDIVVFSYSLAVDATGTGTATSLVRGATGTAEFHPGGDTVGNIEFTTTKATIQSIEWGGDPNTTILADIVEKWDDLTVAAAGA